MRSDSLIAFQDNVRIPERRESPLQENLDYLLSLSEHSNIDLPADTIISVCEQFQWRIVEPKDAERLNALLVEFSDESRQSMVAFLPDEKYHETLGYLKLISSRPFTPLVAKSGTLRQVIFHLYRGSESRLSEILDKQHATLDTGGVGDSWQIESEDDVVQLLKAIVEYSIAIGASDLHIEPDAKGSIVRFRVAGVLISRPRPICGIKEHQRLVNRIKVLANLELPQRRISQEGALSVPVGDLIKEVRVSLIPTLFGERVVMRLPVTEILPPLPSLGFSQEVEVIIRAALKRRGGLILICGRVGCGKSTTLYSMAQFIADEGSHVAILEDPIERRLSGATQIPISESFNYSAALKSVLRQDPEAIFVGEIRDRESAEAIVSAALTGHLVVGSLHAINCLGVIERLERLGVPVELLLSVLRLSIWQSLVPRLCESCKALDLKRSNTFGGQVFRRVGCCSCKQTGCSGRALIYEGFYIASGGFGNKFIESYHGGKDHLKRELITAGCYFNNLSEVQNLVLSGEVALPDIEYLFG